MAADAATPVEAGTHRDRGHRHGHVPDGLTADSRSSSPPVEARRVDGPVLRLADGAQRSARVSPRDRGPLPVAGGIDHPQRVRARVAEEVAAVEPSLARVADDDSADDRAARSRGRIRRRAGVRPVWSQPRRSAGSSGSPPSVFQPKSSPPTPARATSTSSQAFWPTSPIHRSPVTRSKRIRHGLRRPVSQISGFAFGVADERVVGRDQRRAPRMPPRRRCRRAGSWPRSVSSRWPLPCGSPPEPPSPIAM